MIGGTFLPRNTLSPRFENLGYRFLTEDLFLLKADSDDEASEPVAETHLLATQKHQFMANHRYETGTMNFSMIHRTSTPVDLMHIDRIGDALEIDIVDQLCLDTGIDFTEG